MTVLRRLDAVLEPTKQAVQSMKANLHNAGIANQDAALRQAAGQAFYNTPLTPSHFARGRVTWVKYQWKSSAEPGQLSVEINIHQALGPPRATGNLGKSIRDRFAAPGIVDLLPVQRALGRPGGVHD
jgi:hypothetical protein